MHISVVNKGVFWEAPVCLHEMMVDGLDDDFDAMYEEEDFSTESPMSSRQK